MAKRTSRLNSRERKKIYNRLAAYGEKCAVCGKGTPLDTDHKDNDLSNTDFSNFQLLCRSCNIKKNPPYRRDPRLRGDEKKISTSRLARSRSAHVADIPEPRSAEMARNLKSEPVFRKWFENEMKRQGRMLREEAIDSGAEIAEVSIDTSIKYLRKMTSKTGKFQVIKDSNGDRWLEWKDKFNPWKSLKKKYNSQ